MDSHNQNADDDGKKMSLTTVFWGKLFSLTRQLHKLP